MENENTILCPISVLTLQQEILISVHPASFMDLITFLTSLSLPFEERCLNNFLILSQLAGLQHIYNVFSPLVSDAQSHLTLESLKDMNFNNSYIDPNQFLILNLKRDLLDQSSFRMNERIFNFELAHKAEENKEETLSKELYRDHTKTHYQ